MEFLGILISALVAAGIKLGLNKDVKKLGGDVLDAFFGGALEEILEDGIKNICPSGFLTNKRNIKKMLAEIAAVLKEYSDDELMELAKYIRSLDIKDCFEKLSKKYNLKLDLTDFVTGNEALEGEVLKKVRKAFYKVFKQIYDSVKKNQFEDIKYASPRELAIELGGDNNVPDIVVRIFRVVNEYSFRFKYLSMNGDNKDVVKVIQYMLSEHKIDLLDELKEGFDLNAQFRAHYSRQTGDYATPLSKIDVDKIAKTDPFCFVRLECPVCGASGENVVREGDKAHCIACGEKYDIVRNIDEDKITKKLGEVELEMLSKLDESIQMNAKVKKNVEELAGRIVSKAYFEQYMQELNNLQSGKLEETEQNMYARIKLSEENIKKTLDAVSERLESVSDKSSVSEVTGALAERFDSLGNDVNAIMDSIGGLHKKMDTLGKKVDDLSVNLNEQAGAIQRQLGRDMADIKETLGANAPSRVQENRFNGKCPRCGNTVEFRNSPKSNNYICPICKYADDAGRIERSESVDNDAVGLRLDKVNDKLRFIFADGSSADIGQSKTVRAFVFEDGDLNIDDPSFGNVSLARQVRDARLTPERVILISENGKVRLNGYAVKKIVNRYNACVKEIVIGGGIELDTNGLGNWYYDKKKRRVSK